MKCKATTQLLAQSKTYLI